MKDRTLLELAAQAAGIGPVLCYESHRNCLRIGNRERYRLWRPLIDDGDDLRLANKLRLVLGHQPQGEAVTVSWSGQFAGQKVEEFYGEDPDAATRRAIVRAAAVKVLGYLPD